MTPNAAGLPIAVQDGLGGTTTFRRDPSGRIVEVTDPLGHTTRTGWSTEGRLEWRQYPDGSRKTWAWDAEGNLLTHTDPAENITGHTIGHFDVPATRTDPNGSTYAFAYDSQLRLTQVSNPQGRTWTYCYDAAGRLSAETDFIGRTLTYRYDAAGDLISRTNGAGEALHFTRDVLGRVVERRSEAGEATTYAYGPSGEVTRAVNAEAEVVAEYEGLGHLLSETVNGRTTTYKYDILGRRTHRTTPSGLTSTWTYDLAGRPAGLHTENGSLAFAYDAAGRETERRLGDGVTLAQTWDAVDRLTTQSAARSGVADPAQRLLQYRTYAYRADGCLTEIRELTSGTRHCRLDTTGRVTGVQASGWTESYAYDTTGNLTHSAAPGHPSPGERTWDGILIRKADRTTYDHDAQGRLVRRTRKSLSGQTRQWTYTWNSEDRLTAVTTPQGETWHYRYDPLGRRISKQCLAEDGSIAHHTEFLWDGTHLAEQRTSGGQVSTWDYAPGTHRPVVQTDHPLLVREPGVSVLVQLADDTDADRTPRFHAVITDPNGTPTELITAGGDLAWQHRTTLWGTDLHSAEATGMADCPLRFPGQYADRETGLHYNYFRYYDPEIGRYCS